MNEGDLNEATENIESDILEECHKHLPLIQSHDKNVKKPWWNDNLLKMKKELKTLKGNLPAPLVRTHQKDINSLLG